MPTKLEEAQPGKVALPPHGGDDNFRRWVESLERGSITTADVYFRRIGFLSSKLKVEPGQIAAMNAREARDFIHDTITYLETSGNVGSSIESYVKAVKSWMTWNDIDLPKRVKIYGASETPTVENEVTPVTQELRKIFEVGTLRARAICGLMAFGAFRPEVFGNLVADDGIHVERTGGQRTFEPCKRMYQVILVWVWVHRLLYSSGVLHQPVLGKINRPIGLVISSLIKPKVQKGLRHAITRFNQKNSRRASHNHIAVGRHFGRCPHRPAPSHVHNNLG